MKPEMYLPVAPLIELIGILTLTTNESIVGPVDIGFTVPVVLVSGNIQGFGLAIAGSMLAVYAILQMKE